MVEGGAPPPFYAAYPPHHGMASSSYALYPEVRTGAPAPAPMNTFAMTIALTPQPAARTREDDEGDAEERPPKSCRPTPTSEMKLRRNLAEIYNTSDAVLMNHAMASAV